MNEAASSFRKLERLVQELRAINFYGGAKSVRVVVFSERIPTLMLLKAQLGKAFSLSKEAIAVFYGRVGRRRGATRDHRVVRP